MIRAVIFDFDGTIGNTLPLCIAAFRRAIEPLAGKQLPDEEIVATFGPSEEGTIRILAPHAYEQGLADYLNCYRELHDMCPSPFDGIPELLEWLKARGIIIALVTGKGRRSCSISLEQYGIARFFDLVETRLPGRPLQAGGHTRRARPFPAETGGSDLRRRHGKRRRLGPLRRSSCRRGGLGGNRRPGNPAPGRRGPAVPDHPGLPGVARKFPLSLIRGRDPEAEPGGYFR